MKAVFTALAAALSVTALSSPASAERWHYLVKERQAAQHSFIEEGSRLGMLSRSEQKQLRAQQRMIDATANRYKRDGLSNAERNELRAMQDNAAATIFRLRNNAAGGKYQQ